MTAKERKQLHFDDRYPLGLGCLSCEDRPICGGINVSGLFSCIDLCCNSPSTCDFVCPRNVQKFVEDMNSIGDFSLSGLLVSNPIELPKIPFHVPLIYHNSANRSRYLKADAVAVQLFQLIDSRTGDIRVKSRDELCEKFGVHHSAQIVICGIADDPALEKYWFARNPAFIEDLAGLKPDLVTVPNFSSFVNAPRWTDLYNIKRIAMCWAEFTNAGIPTSLHLNARSAFDWQRLTKWIADQGAVRSITFEFATLSADRKQLYVDRLVELSATVPRRLQLVIRGGVAHISKLSKAFDIAFIDSEPFLKASKRQILNGIFSPAFVAEGSGPSTIDALLQHNVSVRNRLLGEKRKSE